MYLTTVFVFASHLYIYSYTAYIEHREQYKHDACVREHNIICNSSYTARISCITLYVVCVCVCVCTWVTDVYL